MSQASIAAARTATRTTTRVASRPGELHERRGQRPSTATVPALRVVRGAQLRAGSGAAFAVVCAALLAVGLLALLMMNTMLSQRAFTLHALQKTSTQLGDVKDSMTQQLELQRSPTQLAKQAQTMGMVPAQSVAFIRLSDGKVLGVAKPAQPQLGFSVVTSPAPGKPKGPVSLKATSPKLPQTMSTSVTTVGNTTTTSTITTVTDAGRNTVKVTIVDNAVTPTATGATTLTTTTVRTTKLTDQGATISVKVTYPDGRVSSSQTTTPMAALSPTAGVTGIPLTPTELNPISR